MFVFLLLFYFECARARACGKDKFSKFVSQIKHPRNGEKIAYIWHQVVKMK